MKKKHVFEKLAHRATEFSGSTLAFMLALVTILIWLITGPYFKYSDTWQLVINTGTTIVTFLMVFLIQRMQNKDSQAIHLKLNELVAALDGPSNRLIDVEEISEEELKILSSYYQKLAEMAKKEKKLSVSHSIEEAMELHEEKYSRTKQKSK
ncbi:MAG: low affinity iron permease family protein [Bacteroidetes bacterium]|nr:low affinity iron permease family protein [Bacteroidota bacterium]